MTLVFNGAHLAAFTLLVLFAVWFLRPRQTDDEKWFEGYTYALTQLRRGTKLPDQLEAEALGFDDRSSFDKGIDDAIDDAVRLGMVIDNRCYP